MSDLTADTPISRSSAIVADRAQDALLDRWDIVVAVAVATLALVIYGSTVTPGLLRGDSGEFQTLTYLLGNTHPTGYPVYLILARLFALAPLGELAYRVNLFSAVMGALAVAGVYLCGRLLTGYRAVAVVGALALAVAPTFWSQALIAEVYTTGAAFIVYILLALLYWDASGKNWALFVTGLLGGLSLGVHLSVALLAPAILLFLLLHWRRGRQMWMAAVAGATLGLGLTIALFFALDWNDPTASYFNSVVEPSHSAWGLTAEQIDGPLEHLRYEWGASQFRFLMFADVGDVMARQAADYWANLPSELGLPLVLLAAVGAIGLIIGRRKVAVLLLGALAIQLGYFFNYDVWDLYVFFIPGYILLLLLSVAGMGAVIDAIVRLLGRVSPISSRTLAILDVALAAVVLGLAVWPTFQPRQTAVADGAVDFEFDEYPTYEENLYDIAAATVAALPENAILFTGWDMMWPYYYAAHVEGRRTDLMFIETYAADDQDEPADSLLNYAVASLPKRPVFFEERLSQLEQTDSLSMSPQRNGPARLFKLTQDE